MTLAAMLDEKRINLHLKSRDKLGVLRELVAMLDGIPDPEQLVSTLLRREELGSTGIGKGIAWPHARTQQVDRLHLALGRSTYGVRFDSVDRGLAHVLFLLVAPPTDPGNAYLITLGRIGTVMLDLSRQRRYMQPKTPKEMLDLIASVEKRLR